MSTTQAFKLGQSYAQALHTATITGDYSVLDPLVEKLGKERVAELGHYYTQATTLQGDAATEAAQKLQHFATDIAAQQIKREQPPRPTANRGIVGSFLLGSQKALEDMARTAELRQKQALGNFDPQAARDAETLANEQLVSDAVYAKQVKEHPTAATLGGASSVASLGVLSGSRLPSAIAAGAAMGAVQPNTGPLTGAALGAGLGLGGGALSLGIGKGIGALSRKVGESRVASTPEFAQARARMEELGIPEVTSNITPSAQQSIVTRELKSALGIDDISQRGLTTARKDIGRQIGEHYRQSNIPIPDTIADDLDAILQVVKTESAEIPAPMSVKAAQILDTVTDETNPNRGQALHTLRQKIGDKIKPDMDKATRDGYRALQQYIDDLALTGLPEGDSAVLRGLQRQFGMVSDISKNRVVDSVTGEIDLNKLQKIADTQESMYGNTRLYDIATGARAGQALHDIAYRPQTSSVLQSMGRGALPYEGWSLIRPFQSGFAAYKAFPGRGLSAIGSGLGLGALPSITNEY